MRKEQNLSLQLRLKNCLQTILDLESDLERLELGHVLLKEYTMLRSFADRVKTIPLREDDVARIERATECFLEELKLPLSFATETIASKQRLMQ